MTIEQAISVATGNDDAHAYEDGSGWSITTTVVNFRSRNTTNLRSGGGFRFKIPADIPASAIETASLRVTAAGATTWSGTILAERIPAEPWATGSTPWPNHPFQRATAALAAGTPSTAVTFNQTTPTIGTAYTSTASSALADDIKAAMGHGSYVAGTSYVSVIFRGLATGTDFGTVYSYEGTGAEAQLVLNLTNLTSSTQTVTPTVVTGVTEGIAAAQLIETESVDYHLTGGDSTRRTCDVIVPTRPAPAGGWPVILWVHGGAFNTGSSSALPQTFRRDAIRNGFAVVAPNYKLTHYTSGTVTDGWTHPSPPTDVLCCAQWIVDNGDKWGLSTEHIIMSGYSAGGHVALEAALLAQDANRDTYLYGVVGDTTTLDRYPAWTAADPDGTAPVDVTQGHTRIPQFAGCFVWAPPVNLTTTYAAVNFAVQNNLEAYLGKIFDSSSISDAQQEGNLDALIEGRAATVYAASPGIVPDFPIGIAYDTNDIICPTAGGYTALYNALNTMGVDVSAASGVVNIANNAFSKESVTSTGHDYIMSNASDAFVWGWFNAVKAQYPKRGQGYPRGDVFPRTTGQGWPRQRRPGAI